jgi:hypothetical protein
VNRLGLIARWTVVADGPDGFVEHFYAETDLSDAEVVLAAEYDTLRKAWQRQQCTIVEQRNALFELSERLPPEFDCVRSGAAPCGQCMGCHFRRALHTGGCLCPSGVPSGCPTPDLCADSQACSWPKERTTQHDCAHGG